MPGNEVDDRAHNFFAQVDLSSGHHRSHTADGSWQGLGNNPWAGGHRHTGLSSSNSEGYNLQQSDIERGQNSHPYQVAPGLNFGQPSLDPELAKRHSQNQLQNPNGYIHGHQSLQTSQNEANFMGVDSESGQYTMISRGLSIYESQGGNSFENNVGSLRPKSSESRFGFDFLGRQQPKSRDNIGVQSLPQQLSGFNDMQVLQQQAMLTKMQELQKQQLETRQQKSLNRNPSIINATPISPITTASNNSWQTEPSTGNKSWLHHATQAVQGSPNEFRFLPEQAQTLSLMGLIPQEVESLYGAPVSNTMGTPNQHSHVSVDKHPMQQIEVYSNILPGHDYTGQAGNLNVQDGSLSSRHGFQEEFFLRQSSGQELPSGMHLGNPQLVNSFQMEVPVHEGKAVLPVSSSQNTVALDPTEEKILFGDDNIWDSFGTGADVVAVGGGWSALMQSAVAETSSSNIGLQEEWSGSSIQNAEAALAPCSNDTNINNNINRSFQGVSGFQRSGPNFPYEHGDRLQVDSTERTFHASTEEGNKWLSRGPVKKPPADGVQGFRNATHSSDAVVNEKTMAGQVPQRNVPHNSGQLYGELNGRDDMEAPSSSGNELSRFYGNESKLQKSGSADQKRIIHVEKNQSAHMWKAVPGSQSMVGLEQVRTVMGSPQVNREDAGLNIRMGRANSSIARASEGKSPNTNNLNFWKQGNEPQLNRCSSNDLVNMHKADKSERKENSTDSHNSNISQHTSAGSSDNNTWLDGSDTRNLIGGKQKLPGQSGNKMSGPRKFQYHPMGNLNEDVDLSIGRKYATDYQSHGYSGQSRIGHFPKMSSEMEKGNRFSVKQNKIEGDDSPSKGTFSGFAPSTSTPFNRGTGIHASDNAAQSRQNVLKSHQKNMDQTKENSNSVRSVGTLKPSQSPSSPGFGLQLGFPSQLSVQSHPLSSHSSAQVDGSLCAPYSTSPKIRENDNTSLISSRGEVKRNDISGTGPSNNGAPQYDMLGNLNSASNSGFPFFRSQLQGQQMIGAIDKHDNHSLQTKLNKKDRPLSSGGTSQINDANYSHERAADKEISMRRPPNTWTNNSQQHLMGGQPCNRLSPSMLCAGQLNNNAVSTPYLQKVSSSGEVQQVEEGLQSSADLAPKPSVSEGKESVLRNQSDASPCNSASTEKDFEAFGRSLKPTNLSKSTYSLLNQMRGMKNTEIDPSNRGLKRFKGAETSVSSQMKQKQSSEQSVMIRDPKTLSFSGSADTLANDSSSQLAKTPTQDVLVPGRMDSGNLTCSTSTSSVRVDHSQISLQMAPSWFEQYGTFKNEQILSTHDAHKYSTLKAIEQRFPLGSSSDTLCANNMERANAAADSNHAGKGWQRSTSTVMVENLPSHITTQDAADKGLVVARVIKRKSSATLPSWHREVTQSSQNFLTTSMADVEWAQETNRLTEKVEVEHAFEEAPPKVRSKRRLIFTTQLMKQLFRPPMAATLYADAYSNYEAVTCMGARIALVDACSLVPRSYSDSHVPLERISFLTGKHKTNESERISGQHIAEVKEHFIGRAKKMESDFVRLDKTASVADLRAESQELEKLSIINRFARFHGRGQADLVSPGPQRYVTALPTPRVLPERVQCLSL